MASPISIIIIVLLSLALCLLVTGLCAQALIVYKSTSLDGIIAQGHYAGCIKFMKRINCYREYAVLQNGYYETKFFQISNDLLTKLGTRVKESIQQLIPQWNREFVKDNLFPGTFLVKIQRNSDYSPPLLNNTKLLSDFISERAYNGFSQGFEELPAISYGGVIYVNYAAQILDRAQSKESLLIVNLLTIITAVGISVSIILELISLKISCLRLATIILLSTAMVALLLHNSLIFIYSKMITEDFPSIKIMSSLEVSQFQAMMKQNSSGYSSLDLVSGMNFSRSIGLSSILCWLSNFLIAISLTAAIYLKFRGVSYKKI